jgi:phage-related baseplate assembly protein
MNLNGLPPVLFAPKDPKTVEANLLKGWEAGGGNPLYPADPRRLFFKTVADDDARLSAQIDHAAKMNLLAYAGGEFLDHIGYLLGVARLPPAAAATTERFMLSAAQPGAVVIARGTRVAKQGTSVYFAVRADTVVPAGQTQIDATVDCLHEGAAGNGFLPDELNTLVDPLPWIASVKNLAASVGGADAEDDEAYRGRIHIAPEKFSVAGPAGAYEYWAKSAQADIADVAVYSPSPGQVTVLPLLAGGVLPNAAVLQRVYDTLSSDSIRPLTDQVIVAAPELFAYDVNLTWWLYREDLPFQAKIAAAVESAVEEWALWERAKIGRDINVSVLIQMVEQAGAKRVEVAAPAFTPLSPVQLAVAQNKAVVFGGEEDG